jgi:hypothetical protein
MVQTGRLDEKVATILLQTRRKSSNNTFALTAFISFGLCNIFAHGKYFLQSAHLSHLPPANTISLQFPPTNSLQGGKFLGGTSPN